MDFDLWISAAICVILVGAAMWLVAVHREHWQEADSSPDLPERDREHLKRRYRRRIQTSTMLGFTGVAILAGRLFPPEDPSVVTVLYWTGVALLVTWMALLAMADMIATQVHYGSQRRKVEGERAKLEAQLRRVDAQRKARESDRDAENAKGRGDEAARQDNDQGRTG